MRAAITSIVGVFLLSAGVQGWFMGRPAGWITRVALICAALALIEGGIVSDLLGVALVGVAFAASRFSGKNPAGAPKVSTT